MIVELLEARPVPPHIAREQSVVDGLVSRYRKAKRESGSSLNTARVFVKHHPHRAETTIRIPAAHAQNLQKHLWKNKVGSNVSNSPTSKKYKIVTIAHDAADYKPAGDTVMTHIRKLHRSITTSLSAVLQGTHAVVLHNFRKLRGHKSSDAWECIESPVLDLVERLDELAGDEVSERFPGGKIDGGRLRSLISAHHDGMKGGKGDRKSPHDFDFHQLLAGVNTEVEHTNDPQKALEIAMDHLAER
jgi:hypothetical protein